MGLIVSLVLVWLCCCWFMQQSSASIVNCSSMETEALIDFKQNLFDPWATLSSWVGHNCCDWYGITCDLASGKVTKIDLHNSNGLVSYEMRKSCLGGGISSSLLHLHNLSYLDLSCNCFQGAPIPYFFGRLTNLRYLSLYDANFCGEIPPHLGNLSHLNYLNLAQSSIKYELHVQNLNWLSGLSSLHYLNLEGLDLSEAREGWMNAVSTLSSLEHLHLRYCGISSLDSPTGLQNLTSLTVLQLTVNVMNNSSLPLWLTNLTTLTTLDLSSSGLHGTISPDIVKLKDLRHLDLSENNLRNSANYNKPIFLLNLCQLQYAYLARNSLGGRLEDLLGSSSNCTHNNLESLDLRYNDLEGEIPNSLGALHKLQYLDLEDNRLWGSLPNSIANLSSLQHLKLSTNSFNGIIPPSFGQLSELISFESYGNSWNGVMTEAHFVNLTKLETFIIKRDTYHKALVFNVSYYWIPPFRLKTLHLRNCYVGPQFPIWLQLQTKLIDVIISQAGISGFIPNEWISHVSSQITQLDLSNNFLEGNLSQLLMSHTHLVNSSHNLLTDHLITLRYPDLIYLILENNSLSGPIPHNISDSMPKLKYLILSKNHLIGNINPSALEKMNGTLEVLSLSSNQFFGELCDDWDKFNSLDIIDLANNNLSGKIPSSIGLKSLTKLMLSNNIFVGEIPNSLENCSYLQSIDLSGNRLHGSLPVWIGVAVYSELQLISLRSNSFNGTVPRQWCNLPELRVLDLSDNNLVGEVPNCLSNWTAFIYNNTTTIRYSYDFDYRIFTTYKEKARLVMKGRELEYGTTLKYVLTIDLSRNKLSGKIPNEITKFMHLGTLNLSHNEFVGIIPDNISAMQNLETLDLSCNHLSGKIPTSLDSLNFLSHLNLSFNNLTGTIPTSNHLQTLYDPSIYEGNPFLHTSPQSKMPSDENANSIHVPISEADTEGKDSEMFSFLISMAIGFPIGLNILFFAIFTSESRRISYFCFVDRVSHNILEKVGILANCFRRKRS